jgi:hypothetical protein
VHEFHPLVPADAGTQTWPVENPRNLAKSGFPHTRE